MPSGDSNPYRASNTASSSARPAPRGRWLRAPLVLLTSYYALSSLTLPFADRYWLGELPVCALPQLPKAYAFDQIQDILISLMRVTGRSSGSPSPDMIASKPWAFALLFILPAATIIGLTRLFRRAKPHGKWTVYLLVTACVDAAVTVWFERTSNLLLF